MATIQSELASKIGRHYVYNAVTSAHRVVGSIAALGDPAGLFEDVGTGVKSFFYEPWQGAKRSPAEFGKGVARGTAGLFGGVSSGLLHPIESTAGWHWYTMRTSLAMMCQA